MRTEHFLFRVIGIIHKYRARPSLLFAVYE